VSQAIRRHVFNLVVAIKEILMSNRLYWFPICVCTLILTACVTTIGTGVSQAASQQTATKSVAIAATIMPNNPPVTCPITHPSNILFTPPSPYPATPPSNYAGEFWYGTPELWTMLRTDGTWSSLPQNGVGYTQKIFWWRQGYDINTEPRPKLTVIGKRLDASAPPLSASSATNARSDLGDAMLVGVDIPTLGCWEITGQYNGTELSFVVWIAP
jgi:hypothetical protein